MKKWLVMIVVLSLVLIGMLTYTACNYEEEVSPEEKIEIELKMEAKEKYSALNTEYGIIGIKTEKYETENWYYIYKIYIVNENGEEFEYIASWVSGEISVKQINY